jgi:hypothetical protein
MLRTMSAPSRQLGSFQFRLQSLFIFMLIVAILSWLVTIVPGDFWFLLVLPTLPLVAMTASILGVIYLRGGWRAFWVGYGVCLIQVVVLGLFFEVFEVRGPFRELEVLILVPLFVVGVPALTGWIGFRFYRNGQIQATVPPAQAAATVASEIDQAA